MIARSPSAKLIKLVVICSLSIFLFSCNKSEEDKKTDIGKESQKINIKMAGAFPSSLIILGETGIKLTQKINDVSGGNINIKYFDWIFTDETY